MTEKISEILKTVRPEIGTESYSDDRDDILKEEIERQRTEYKIKQAEKLWLDSNVGKRFEKATFETYIGNDEVKNACMRWADNYANEEGTGLVLCGNYGTGKTHLATATARTVLEKYGARVWFSTFAGMLQELKSAYGSSDDFAKAMHKYKTVDLLVIDDLGKENMTAWGSETLFTIVDERYRNMKSLIITTNLMPNELGKHIDEAIMSRLAEICTFVRVKGEDYRLKKLI